MPLKLEFARYCSKSISRIALFSTRTLHRLNQAIPPKISSRAIRRVSRPFHHVCRTIIIQLLGKRQIFHSIWNRLNTKGNTPGLFNTGDEIKIQNSTAMDTISPCDAYVWGRAYRIMNQRCPATDVSRYSSVCLSVQILRPVALPIFSEQARRGTRRANKLRPDKLEPAPLPPPRGHVHRGYIYIYRYSVSLSCFAVSRVCRRIDSGAARAAAAN